MCESPLADEDGTRMAFYCSFSMKIFDYVIIVRWIRVKIALNVVKASKLVQIKLIFDNFLLLFSRQYRCLRKGISLKRKFLKKFLHNFTN